MRILITGSEGTLGLPLQEELQHRGHEVFGLDVKHGPKPNVLRCDVGNYRELESAIKQVDPEFVYHLAAEFGRVNGDLFYEKVWQTNAVGTHNVLELQVKHKFKLAMASSSEMYGDSKENWLSEDTVASLWLNDYACSKMVNEVQCKNFRRKYGNQIVIMRFFNTYGPGEYYTPYRSVCSLFCYRALKGIPFSAHSNSHRVFLYIDDFTPTLANACDKFVDGEVINIGGTEYRSVEELAEIVLAETQASRSLLTILEEDKWNTLNKRPNIFKAMQLLGHNPKIMLEEGIRKTVEWMKKVYEL